MKMIDLSCPKCGASIEPDLENERCICKYCGHQMLIEKEDTLEEIAAKARSKAYGYHKGKLQAEAEIAQEAQMKQKRNYAIPVIIMAVLVTIGLLTTAISYLAKPKVNPFECIEVSFKGIDGDGEVIIKMVGKEEIDPNRIKYDVSKNSNLGLGETISIIATSSDYRLSEKTKIYTVEGLDEYLKELDNIPKEVLELLYQKAENVQETNLSTTKECGYFVDMKPVKLFLLTDGEQNNELYVVHEANFITEEGYKTFYVTTGFEDVVIRKGDQISINMSFGMYYGNIFTEVDSPIYISAYGSIEEVRTELLTGQGQYMELKEQDL